MTASDYTDRLRQLMLQVNLSSWASLYRATGLPRYQIQRLRQGQIQVLPVASLVTLSQVLQTSLPQLLEQFTSMTEPLPVRYDSGASERLTLKAEYRRLQKELEQQAQDLEHLFQQTVLQILEPLLLQWPTAAYAARQNPRAPAIKLLPLLHPLDQLLQSWGIEAIGVVGEETPYDPQWHQPLEGAIAVHDIVRVRYVGYRRGEQLLYRAKVSLVS
jgi:molecular chaperone GrpE (heat shock protein)